MNPLICPFVALALCVFCAPYVPDDQVPLLFGASGMEKRFQEWFRGKVKKFIETAELPDDPDYDLGIFCWPA